MLTLRYGSKRIELKPGKPAIEVGEEGHLLPTLKLIREAVAAGELDKLLMAAKEQRGRRGGAACCSPAEGCGSPLETSRSVLTMRYAQQALRPGEGVLAVGKFHWLDSAAAYLWFVLLGVFLFRVIICLAMIIRKWTTLIVVTTDRLIYTASWMPVTPAWERSG